MKYNQILKLAVVLLVSTALSGCNLAKLAGINTGDDGDDVLITQPLSSNVRKATISDAMTVWYPNKTLAEIKVLLIAELKITAEVAETYISQSSLDAELVWYDKDGKVLGPVYWHPTDGRIIAPKLDNDPTNDAGVDFLTATNAPKCLPNCINVPLIGIGVSPALVALHTANYKGTGSVNAVFKDGSGSVVQTDKHALAVNLAADFDNAKVKGTAIFKGGDQDTLSRTIALNETNIRGAGFTGTTTVSTSEAGTFADQSGVYGGQFSADGSKVSGDGSGTIRGIMADNDTTVSAAYDFDFNADKAKVVVVDPATAVRAGTVDDLLKQQFPGKTLEQVKAEFKADFLRNGGTEAQADSFLSKFMETTPTVWYDKDGKEVGPLYFDPKTNSIVPNNRDGDASNDTGTSYNPKGIIPDCVPDCGPGLIGLGSVAPELVAKHSATYTGAGEYKIDVKESNLRDYTAVTTDTLTANFDNGTIGGKSVHKEGGVSTGDTVTIQLYDGLIQGKTFNGDMVAVDNPGGSVLFDNYGSYSGQFNADGTAASGAGSGSASGTIPTPAGGTWEADYELKFNVTEKK